MQVGGQPANQFMSTAASSVSAEAIFINRTGWKSRMQFEKTEKFPLWTKPVKLHL